MMSWSSRKKKGRSFCNVHFFRRKCFISCVLSQCIVYWINFQNIYTYTYQNTLLLTFLLLVFKTVESVSFIAFLRWLRIKDNRNSHRVKSVRICSFSGLSFSAFGLNTERYSLSLRIQSEYEKIRIRKTPNTGTFNAGSIS